MEFIYNHLNRYRLLKPQSGDADAVLHTCRCTLKLLSMAALPTIIGFISLLTSQVYPIKYFGLFTAFGIFMAYVLALIFLPSSILILAVVNIK